MPAYIFLGPELGKKQDAVKSVRIKISSDAEEYIFYAGETSAANIANIIQNHSLFTESRIIIIKNTELIKKKDEIDLLVSCINNMDKHTTIFLLSEENKIAAGFDDVKGSRQIFYELFEKEKQKWVESYFQREGFRIDRDCIAAILEMVENNTEALRRECSHVVNFLKRNKAAYNEGKIKTEDIEKWLSHNREESAFTLFTRIAAGDITKALECLAVLLAAKESGPGILAGLTWCYRKLGDYIELLNEKGEPAFHDLKKIGLSAPSVKENYVTAARRYSSGAVEECLALTAKYDILLRSPVAVMENILMDMYIISVINTGKKN